MNLLIILSFCSIFACSYANNCSSNGDWCINTNYTSICPKGFNLAEENFIQIIYRPDFMNLTYAGMSLWLNATYNSSKYFWSSSLQEIKQYPCGTFSIDNSLLTTTYNSLIKIGVYLQINNTKPYDVILKADFTDKKLNNLCVANSSNRTDLRTFCCDLSTNIPAECPTTTNLAKSTTISQFNLTTIKTTISLYNSTIFNNPQTTLFQSTPNILTFNTQIRTTTETFKIPQGTFSEWSVWKDCVLKVKNKFNNQIQNFNIDCSFVCK